MEQVKKFVFDVGWGLSSAALAVLIGFLVRVVLARWLGADDLGFYSMMTTIMDISIFIAVFGVSQAVIKRVSEYLSNNERLIQIAFAALFIATISGLLIGILLYTLSGFIANLFDMPKLAELLKVIAFAFPFAVIFQIELGLYNALRKMKLYAGLTILRSLLMIIFSLILVWLGFGIKGAAWGIVIAIVCGCVCGLLFLRAIIRIDVRNLVKDTKLLMSFGSKIFIADALDLILNYSDTLLIGYFLTVVSVGYYSVAVNISMMMKMIPQAIQKISYPATAAHWLHKEHQALRTMMDRSMKYSACVIVPIGLGIGFFRSDIINLIFGSEFIPASQPLMILLISAVIHGSTIHPVGLSLSAAGRPDLAAKISAVAAVLNIALNILLIPPLGIAGAAIATALSVLVGAFAQIFLLPKILGFKIDLKWYAKFFGSAAIAIAAFVVATRYFNEYLVGGLILACFVALVVTYFIDRKDLLVIISLVRSVVPRR